MYIADTEDDLLKPFKMPSSNPDLSESAPIDLDPDIDENIIARM